MQEFLNWLECERQSDGITSDDETSRTRSRKKRIEIKAIYIITHTLRVSCWRYVRGTYDEEEERNIKREIV